jgi:FixJ family two-component response regulator
VPSCLILDVSLPGISGLELQSRISEDRLAMPIIFITGHGDIPMTVRAMKAGAIEFLTKPLTDEALVAAVKQALEHSRTALADQRILLELQTHFSSLSPRERDVMALVVTGMLNKQVGAELGISEITVKAHRGRVMQKMKADSLADLVQIATKLGLHRLPTA